MYKQKYLKYKKKYLLLEKQIGGELKDLLMQIRKTGINSLSPIQLQEFLSHVKYIHIAAHGSIGSHLPFLITPGTEILTLTNIGSGMSATTGEIGQEFNKYLNSFLQNDNTFIKPNTQTSLTDAAKHFFADRRFISVKSPNFTSEQIKNHYCEKGKDNCLINNIEFNFTDKNKDIETTFGIYFILKDSNRTSIEINATDSNNLFKIEKGKDTYITLEKIVKKLDSEHKHSYIIASCRTYSLNSILDAFIRILTKNCETNVLITSSKIDTQKKWDSILTEIITNFAKTININEDYFNSKYKQLLSEYSKKLTLFLNTADYVKDYLDAYHKNIVKIESYEKYTIFDNFYKLKEIIGIVPFINLNKYELINDDDIWEHIFISKPSKSKKKIEKLESTESPIILMRGISQDPVLERSLSDRSKEELIAIINELTTKK
jgi:hypothetical protein